MFFFKKTDVLDSGTLTKCFCKKTLQDKMLYLKGNPVSLLVYRSGMSSSRWTWHWLTYQKKFLRLQLPQCPTWPVTIPYLLHPPPHCLRPLPVQFVLHCFFSVLGEEARHRPRDNGTTGQRDNGTPGQRDNGTTGHRANGTPGQRDTGPTGQPTGRANRESQRDNGRGAGKLQGKHAWDQQARQPSNKTWRRMARERRSACYSVAKMRMISRNEIEIPCQILSKSRQR